LLIENSGKPLIQISKYLHGNFSFSVAEGIFQFKTYRIISNRNVSEICLKVHWVYENDVFKKKNEYDVVTLIVKIDGGGCHVIVT
jgi:hypothetical protein